MNFAIRAQALFKTCAQFSCGFATAAAEVAEIQFVINNAVDSVAFFDEKLT